MLLHTETGAVLDLCDASSLHLVCYHSQSPKGELVACVPEQTYDFCGIDLQDMRREYREVQITLPYPVSIAEDILKDMQVAMATGEDRFDLCSAVHRAFHQFHHARCAARRAWWSLASNHLAESMTA